MVDCVSAKVIRARSGVNTGYLFAEFKVMLTEVTEGEIPCASHTDVSTPKEELHRVIHSLTAQGSSSVEIHQLNVYSEHVLFKSCVKEWAVQFQCDRERVLDDPCLGQSHVAITSESIHKADNLVRCDKQQRMNLLFM